MAFFALVIDVLRSAVMLRTWHRDRRLQVNATHKENARRSRICGRSFASGGVRGTLCSPNQPLEVVRFFRPGHPQSVSKGVSNSTLACILQPTHEGPLTIAPLHRALTEPPGIDLRSQTSFSMVGFAARKDFHSASDTNEPNGSLDVTVRPIVSL